MRFLIRVSSLAAAAAAALVVSTAALAATTTRLSVSSTGARANAFSYKVSTSADGKAAFASPASNLVPGDTNGVQAVFFRSGTSTQLVSVSNVGGWRTT